MSFNLTHPLPRELSVAVSGGIDSMSVLHFLNQTPGRVKAVVHINHKTGDYSDEAAEFVSKTCRDLNIELMSFEVKEEPSKGQSLEEFWRNQRYNFFDEAHTFLKVPIVLAHHLDDILEEYISCTMIRGYVGTIPYQHGPCVRPFRLWRKSQIIAYARSKNLQWLEDPSNCVTDGFTRNTIRHDIVPRLKIINPGIYQLAKRAVGIQDRFDETKLEL